MENYKRRAIELISNLALEYKGYPAVIPYTPQKSNISAIEPSGFRRCSPEACNISSAALTRLLTRLEECECANVHSILVLKDNRIICEASRPGYSARCFHLSHSMSKSVIGIVVGLLFDDGILDTGALVADFFPEIPEAEKKYPTLRLDHLLTMKSGISFSEIGSVTECDWTVAALCSEPDKAPGEEFSYNSMNSYLLSAIASRTVRENYGVPLTEYVKKRLFSPLGIKNYLWELSPEGIEKGGWGLYLSTESWAKIGSMMLNGGVYASRRVLSELWIKRSTATHAITPSETGSFNYGYQMWVSREGNDFLFSGMLGQCVWISPNEEIVVSVSSGNNELFQKSKTLEIITDTLGSLSPKQLAFSRANAAQLYEKERSFFRSRCWISERRPLQGLPYLIGIYSRRPYPTAFERLIGRYDFPKNNQGLMPFFIRLMQNNYQGGIESFTFERVGEKLVLTSTEGSGSYSLKFGFYSYEDNAIDVCGERYIIRALADAAENESGASVFRLELIFPELPNTKRLTLSLDETLALRIKMNEIPDSGIADSFIASVPAMSPHLKYAFDLLERNLGKGFIHTKLDEAFSPELVALRTDSREYESILAEENEKFRKKQASSRLIRSMITKFITASEKKVAQKSIPSSEKLAKGKKEKPHGIGGNLMYIIQKILN